MPEKGGRDEILFAPLNKALGHPVNPCDSKSTENPLIRRRAIRKISIDVDLATLFNISNPRLAYSSSGFARPLALGIFAAMARRRWFFCLGVERRDALSAFTPSLPDER